MYDRAQELAVALDLNCQGSLDRCRRIHGPAQLVGHAPARVPQLFLAGVGHFEKVFRAAMCSAFVCMITILF